MEFIRRQAREIKCETEKQWSTDRTGAAELRNIHLKERGNFKSRKPLYYLLSGWFWRLQKNICICSFRQQNNSRIILFYVWFKKVRIIDIIIEKNKKAQNLSGQETFDISFWVYLEIPSKRCTTSERSPRTSLPPFTLSPTSTFERYC